MRDMKFYGIIFGIIASFSIHAESNHAHAQNLFEFELKAPELSSRDLLELQINENLEADTELQMSFFEAASHDQSFQISSNGADRIVVEIYQNSAIIGKQFLVVRENDRVLYAFAVSAGREGKPTPGGTFKTRGQLWRHMSSLYPGSGENNMDHVTYFYPAIGFHSTTFGVYSILGTKASHGCIRMGRPEARAVFSLIRKNLPNVEVRSFKSGDPHPAELSEIKNLLADDFNFIQSMINSRNKGDVPFTEAQYYQYLKGDMSRREVSRLMENAGIEKILEVDKGKDRIPE